MNNTLLTCFKFYAQFSPIEAEVLFYLAQNGDFYVSEQIKGKRGRNGIYTDFTIALDRSKAQVTNITKVVKRLWKRNCINLYDTKGVININSTDKPKNVIIMSLNPDLLYNLDRTKVCLSDLRQQKIIKTYTAEQAKKESEDK